MNEPQQRVELHDLSERLGVASLSRRPRCEGVPRESICTRWPAVGHRDLARNAQDRRAGAAGRFVPRSVLATLERNRHAAVHSEHLAIHVRRVAAPHAMNTKAGAQFRRLSRPAFGLCWPNFAVCLPAGAQAGISGVQTGPGATTLTRMPFCAPSSASALEK